MSGAVAIGVIALITVLGVAGSYVLVARAEGGRADDPVVTAPTSTTPTEPLVTTPVAPEATTHPPAEVSVVVLNATEQRGWAGQNRDRLTELGFPTSATDASADSAVTSVFFTDPAYEGDARAVAEALGFAEVAVAAHPGEPLAADSSDLDAKLVVVLGADSVG